MTDPSFESGFAFDRPTVWKRENSFAPNEYELSRDGRAPVFFETTHQLLPLVGSKDTMVYLAINPCAQTTFASRSWARGSHGTAKCSTSGAGLAQK